MRDVVVTETFEDIDKDKDGKISIDEYIGDMYKAIKFSFYIILWDFPFDITIAEISRFRSIIF